MSKYLFREREMSEGSLGGVGWDGGTEEEEEEEEDKGVERAYT